MRNFGNYLPGRTPGIEIETSTFANDWQKMLEEPKFSDVVFLLEDGQEKLEAHKLILCSTSNFFRQILGLPNTTKVKIRVHVYSEIIIIGRVLIFVDFVVHLNHEN